ADVLMDEDVRNNPAVYPAQAVLDNLFISKSLPSKVQRVKTRSWTRFKSGR
ncbi:MAG: spermidine/putrescine ABC transporter substrate-binding protein PotF, partial [Pseudomonadaceae bacterium]|nr:spermidine/putrescine ABC transporter substrate-binding protein PotF [Pseudomonadaceae bacterium]